MFGYRAKLSLLCIFGLFVLCHWLEAAKFKNSSENDENDLEEGSHERSVDELTSMDAAGLQAKSDAKRRYTRKRRLPGLLAFDNRRRTGRWRSGRRRRFWR